MKQVPGVKNLKKKVANGRALFQDSEFELDLGYIWDRPAIIAMSIPASDFLTRSYRNDIKEVAKMLEKYHGSNHYLILNLSGKKYDYAKFAHNVLDFSFPDHHNPPLDLLFSVVLSLDNWLRADPANVAVVHCVGGKGRTGTVIAAYLLFIRAFDNPTEALAHFGRRRGGDSVTRAAQIRYVEYFHQLLEQKARPVPKSLLLRRVVLIGIPAWSRRRKGQKQDQKGARLVLKIFSARRSRKQLLYCTLQLGSLADFSVLSDECLIWALPSDFTIKGEVLLTFYHQKKSKKLVELFRYNFHTGFVEDLGGTILTKHDMDYKHDSVKKKLPEDFSVQLFMEAYSADKEEMEEDSKVAAVYNTVFELRTKLYSQRFEIEQSQQSQPQEAQQIDDKEE